MASLGCRRVDSIPLMMLLLLLRPLGGMPLVHLLTARHVRCVTGWGGAAMSPWSLLLLLLMMMLLLLLLRMERPSCIQASWLSSSPGTPRLRV